MLKAVAICYVFLCLMCWFEIIFLMLYQNVFKYTNMIA